MALKTLSFPDSAVGPYRKGKRPDCRRQEVDIQSQVEGGDGPILTPAGGPSHERLDSHDYHIALVPQERPSSAGFISRSSTISRVFLLPLTWQELLQKVRGEFTPAESRDQTMISRFGEVTVNFATMQVIKSEKPVALTTQQFKLLRFLTQAPEKVLSRVELLNEVWGYNNYPSTRTVDTHICSLRRKLELNPARPVHFLTVHGLGYRFVP